MKLKVVIFYGRSEHYQGISQNIVVTVPETIRQCLCQYHLGILLPSVDPISKFFKLFHWSPCCKKL